MPHLTTSAVLDAPPGPVWTLLRDFAAIGSWHPVLPPAAIDDGPVDRVGAVRVSTGGHRERLIALDDTARSIRYAFEDNGGLPVRDYVSGMRVVAASTQSVVEWDARYDCDEADEDKVAAAVRDGVLLPGLAALQTRFATEGA
ncbi:SRPBCC family protein [Amycolatopsis mongoliensis]|uniref:SRPBCC family protein n=1 Tax=Amycolatopsis mongoliensis TaxID=715475 RepID=A0A9Y2NDP9_9PSEU|nr:SRPBCC family protein [Amycolatopsis sp. 4-36]WIY00932.1 SRPBCC family protein [Amycolatopsis sp. 4-36]